MKGRRARGTFNLGLGSLLQGVQWNLKGKAGAQTKKNQSFQDLIEVGLAANRPFQDLIAQVNHLELVFLATLTRKYLLNRFKLVGIPKDRHIIIKPTSCLEKRGWIWPNDIFQKCKMFITRGFGLIDFRCSSYIVKHPAG